MEVLAHENRWKLRSALGLLALGGVIALGVWLLQRPGAPFGPAPLSPALTQELVGASGRPVARSAALTCFRRLGGGWEVRGRGEELIVTLPGRATPMTIAFRRSERAAIIWAFDHHQDDNEYRNTNWFDSPLQLSDPVARSLGHCLS